MASALDPQPILAGLRGIFAREAGRTALLQYAADRIQAAGPALHLGLPLHAAR